MDRLDEWRVFTTVATLRSFSAAARTLGRSPQGVTRAVAALEHRLRTRLLHRTTRSVSLSADGQRHLEQGRRLLHDFDVLESGAGEDSALTGTLSVTASVLFGQQHVAPVVREFLQANPAVQARLTLLDRVVSLAEESIDVAVRIGALPDSSLLARPLGQVRLVTCASPRYLERHGTPRAPEALERHTCIAMGATSPLAERWSFPHAGKPRRVAVRPRLVVNTAQAALDAAIAGFGITRLLSYQVASALEERKLRLVLTGFEPRPVPLQLVYSAGPRSRVAEAFIALASNRLRVFSAL